MKSKIIPITIDIRLKPASMVFEEIAKEIKRGCYGFPLPRRVELHKSPRLAGGKLVLSYKVSDDRERRAERCRP